MDIYQKEVDAMKEIVDVCVGIPRFSYAMQLNAERPSGTYAAIKCLSSVNPGYDETRLVEIDGKTFFRTRGVRVLTFAILFSREGSEYAAFDNSYYRQDVKQVMLKHGFAALGKTQLDLASITLETNWEFRQGIKAQFNVLAEQLSELDNMSNATVGSKFVDGSTVIIKGS